MNVPNFSELLVLRNAGGADIADRYAVGGEIVNRYSPVTTQRFDNENGLPVVVCGFKDTDVPFVLAALGRSTTRVAPIFVNNAPGEDVSGEYAERMGAQVIDEPTKGQMKAMQTGIQKAANLYPSAPILLTDADTMPQKKWAATMVRRAKLSQNIGGIAFGGEIFEHGASMMTDALRTAYAIGGDVLRRVYHATPRARGPNTLLQLDTDNRLMSKIIELRANVFPADLVLRNQVIAAGGEVRSVLEPRAIVLTRGDRFDSVADLARDLFGQVERIDLYRRTGHPDLETPTQQDSTR